MTSPSIDSSGDGRGGINDEDLPGRNIFLASFEGTLGYLRLHKGNQTQTTRDPMDLGDQYEPRTIKLDNTPQSLVALLNRSTFRNK
ncbi:hypothetical protein KIN20_026928 [Parelaphostrongylus tenuis]|uniref:Uncharacterized protein n=1 Tax=Parelaphostrongylus tenuis TaxID=148309 RepID=A0AAD5QYX6_PARTN|nr:hypothetical protein KIN20_026928 [Parelaphostrongylus tenuis]